MVLSSSPDQLNSLFNTVHKENNQGETRNVR